ncbi:MAG: hypothetical protein ABIP80_00955 [Ferruginibacter sp.]
MPLQTKIVLSKKELNLVKNDEWILAKQVIINKGCLLLNESIQFINGPFPVMISGEYIPTEPPKIYKGENYLGLPYVTLDYPRWFNKADVFALRTMFWWGNFFSVTLHLTGKYKQSFESNIISNYKKAPLGYFVCIHPNQWHHHFKKDNYVLLTEMSEEQINKVIREKNFLKIAVKFDIEKFNEMPQLLAQAYLNLSEMLA